MIKVNVFAFHSMNASICTSLACVSKVDDDADDDGKMPPHSTSARAASRNNANSRSMLFRKQLLLILNKQKLNNKRTADVTTRHSGLGGGVELRDDAHGGEQQRAETEAHRIADGGETRGGVVDLS